MTVAVGPLRCLATIRSASPARGDSALVGVLPVQQDHDVAILLDAAALTQVGQERALVRCAARGRG